MLSCISQRALLRPSLRICAATRSFRPPAHRLHTTRPLSQPTALNNILAGGAAPAVQVKTITNDGIVLADGLIIPSACIFLNGKTLLWNVPEHLWDGWKEEHFEVFEAVVPKPGAFRRII